MSWRTSALIGSALFVCSGCLRAEQAPLAEESAPLCSVASEAKAGSITQAYSDGTRELRVVTGPAGLEGSLKVGGIEEVTVTAIPKQTHAEITLTYAGAMPLILHLELSKTNQVTGQIDGHPIVPFDASAIAPGFALELADGTPLPSLPASHAHLQKALEGLADQQKCSAFGTSLSQLAPVPARPVIGGISCSTCADACQIYNATFCVTLGSAACGFFLFVPFAGPALFFGCIAIHNLGICLPSLAVCVGNCHRPPQACCPVGCGTKCCARGEGCLDATLELCCASGTTPCFGPQQSCTGSGETCMPDGSSCPNTHACNTRCCSVGSHCADFAASRCEPDCTTSCNERCCPQGQFCIDLANSTCAPIADCPSPTSEACPGLGYQECCLPEHCAYRPDGTAVCL